MKKDKIYLAVFIPIIVFLVIIIAILSIVLIVKFETPDALFSPDYFLYENERYYMLDEMTYDYIRNDDSVLVAAQAMVDGESKRQYVAYFFTAFIGEEAVKIMDIPDMSARYVNNIDYAHDSVK